MSTLRFNTWQNTGGTEVANSTLGTGKIIAVKHALFTGTQTNSTAGGASFSITDLSITHTLADSANKLIISAYVGVIANSDDLGEAGIAIDDGGTVIGVGDAAGSRARVNAGGRLANPGDTRIAWGLSTMFVYEPGDTSSHTYTVKAINLSSATGTIYINRNESDPNNTGVPRGSSGFVIQEVSA